MSIEIERDRAAIEESWRRDEEHDHQLEQRRYAPAIPSHKKAAARSAVIRSRRATLKLRINDGEGAEPYLTDPPDWLDSMLVADLLRSQRYWGATRVNRTMFRCGVSPFATVGALTARQRRALVEAVR